jgi:hypothetical protein
MQATIEPTTATIPSGRKVPPPRPSRGLKLLVTQTPEEKRKREEKNRVKRATAAKELYETEVTYVRSIMILTNVLFAHTTHDTRRHTRTTHHTRSHTHIAYRTRLSVAAAGNRASWCRARRRAS